MQDHADSERGVSEILEHALVAEDCSYTNKNSGRSLKRYRRPPCTATSRVKSMAMGSGKELELKRRVQQWQKRGRQGTVEYSVNMAVLGRPFLTRSHKHSTASTA